MQTNAKLKILFEEWQQARGYAGFFQDGVIGEKDWENHSPRIMFLLKENYSEDWDGIDGPIDIRSGTNRKFFSNLAKWKYLIEQVCLTANVHDYPSDEELCKIQGGWDLSNAAYVNIKKGRGTSRSSNNNIRSSAKTDREYLKREFDLIDPQVILCCGTFRPYCDVYDGENTIREFVGWVHMHGPRVVIDFYHPGWWQCPGGQKGLYDKLKIALNDRNVIEAIIKACR